MSIDFPNNEPKTIENIVHLVIEQQPFITEDLIGFKGHAWQKDYFVISKKSGKWLVWNYNNEDIGIEDLSDENPNFLTIATAIKVAYSQADFIDIDIEIGKDFEYGY